MIPIKIQCGCGQRYAFETEPVEGRMPFPVACPVCGTDGTEAANAALAQSFAAAPAVATAPRAPLRVPLADSGTAPAESAPAATRYRPARLPGQLDRPQAEIEARAKISWGDPPKEVVKFLMMQGLSAQEATALVDELFRERAATIRKNGFVKIIFGSVMVCVPIGAYIGFMSVGYFPAKVFGLTVMVGLYGAYSVLKGIFMVVAPKSERGDVATQ